MWEEGQLVSNIDVVCATTCFAEFNDSSMHAHLALMLGRVNEYFILLGQCEL